MLSIVMEYCDRRALDDRVKEKRPEEFFTETTQDVPYSSKSNIWALGCLLYELRALRPRFAASNLPSMFYKITQGDSDPVPNIYSDNICSLIRRMLCCSPEDRPSAARILGSSYLQRHLGSLKHAECAPENISVGKSHYTNVGACYIEPTIGADVPCQPHSWEDKEFDLEASSTGLMEKGFDPLSFAGRTKCDYTEDFGEDDSLSSHEELSDHSLFLSRTNSAEPIVIVLLIQTALRSLTQIKHDSVEPNK